MSKKAVMAVVALVACAAVATAGPASAGGGAATKVTIKGPGDIFGKLISSKNKCMNDRKVTVYKQKGKRGGSNDKKVASDISELSGGKGSWSVGQPGVNGRIYAKAGKKSGCKVGFSKTIRV
jgi:hypothetical protein